MFHRDVGAPVLEREQKFVADGEAGRFAVWLRRVVWMVDCWESGLFGRVRIGSAWLSKGEK